jgi:hypothetical protein
MWGEASKNQLSFFFIVDSYDPNRVHNKYKIAKKNKKNEKFLVSHLESRQFFVDYAARFALKTHSLLYQLWPAIQFNVLQFI